MPPVWRQYGKVVFTGTRLSITPGDWTSHFQQGGLATSPMPAGSKWMPCVWVDGQLVYGTVIPMGNLVGDYDPTTIYPGELPFYGGQIDIDGDWPVGEEPPPLPSDGADLITSSGAFTISGSGVDYANLVSHGYDWVSFQAVNGGTVLSPDLDTAKAAGFGSGFGVGVWGVVYSKSDFFAFGQRLGEQAVALGAEHVIVDAEECYKDTRGTLMGQQIIDGLIAGGWTGPVHLSTLSNPVDPARHDFGMDTESFLKTGGGILPQVYPNEFPDANYTASAAKEYWMRMGVPASMLNMSIGTYDGVAPMTGEEWVAHLQAGGTGANFNLFLAESTDEAEFDALDEMTGAGPPPEPPPPAEEGGGIRIPEGVSVIEVHIYAAAPTMWGGDPAWEWGHFDYVDNGLPMKLRIAPPGQQLPPVEEVLPMAWGFFNELYEPLPVSVEWWDPFIINGRNYRGTVVGLINAHLTRSPATILGIQAWFDPESIDPENPPVHTVMMWEGQGGSRAGDADLPVRQVTQEITTGAGGRGWNNFFFDQPYVWEEGSSETGDLAAEQGWFSIGWSNPGEHHAVWVIDDDVIFAEYFPEHQKGYFQDNYPAISFGNQFLGLPSDNVPTHRPYFGIVGVYPIGPIVTYIPGPPKFPPSVPPPGPPDITAGEGPYRGIDISFTDSPLTPPDWTQVDDKGIERQYEHPLNASDLKGTP